MKSIKDMSLGEFAAFVHSSLKEDRINVVLSGGSCVSIYSNNRYQSYDLDFIETMETSRKKIKAAMIKMGFYEKNHYYKHSETKFFVEFPQGPISVGNQIVKKFAVMEFLTGRLQLLSPTDCVKDRLAAYYHWKDKQSLDQAILVAKFNKINMPDIDNWSDKEGKKLEFEEIKNLFKRTPKKNAKPIGQSLVYNTTM